MFTFVFVHLGNLILGLVGIDSMESMRSVSTRIIHSFTGSVVLATSILVHFSIAMRALYRSPFLKLPRWQQLQLISGIAMILLLIPHAVPVRIFHQGFNVDTTYPLILQHLWLNPEELLRQYALLITAWLHICLGLHYWLKTKLWYRRNLFWIYAIAILWPTLAIIGSIQAGYEAFEYDIVELNDPQLSGLISLLKTTLIFGVIGICLLVLLLKLLIRTSILKKNTSQIFISDAEVKATSGQTVLDALNFAGIPHASVCGGRARCTTCRIRVNEGMNNLEAVGELENLALNRISAPPSIRLACQSVVKGDVNISALLPADATMKLARPLGGLSGEEKQIVVMFVDLRESTKLAEHKLPYDVLFLLNEFFTQMSISLQNTGGHFAQFSGDGLMALYGLQADLKSACRQALFGAREMLMRMQELNSKMHADLEHPLRIGIGLHCGEAIVGSMGPPKSPNYSAIGDSINIAARLEAQTKSRRCLILISRKVLEKADADYSGLDEQSIPIRGRGNDIRVYAIQSLIEMDKIVESIS